MVCRTGLSRQHCLLPHVPGSEHPAPWTLVLHFPSMVRISASPAVSLLTADSLVFPWMSSGLCHYNVPCIPGLIAHVCGSHVCLVPGATSLSCPCHSQNFPVQSVPSPPTPLEHLCQVLFLLRCYPALCPLRAN